MQTISRNLRMWFLICAKMVLVASLITLIAIPRTPDVTIRCVIKMTRILSLCCHTCCVLLHKLDVNFYKVILVLQNSSFQVCKNGLGRVDHWVGLHAPAVEQSKPWRCCPRRWQNVRWWRTAAFPIFAARWTPSALESVSDSRRR